MPSVPYQLFRDYRIPKGASTDFFREAADRVPDPGDIHVVSYPKCGTTWMQHVVYLLLKDGQAAESVSQVVDSIPFPEQDGFPSNGHRFLALKSHIPRHLLNLSENARYVYVARNPKDTCVSYYQFLKNLPGYRIDNFDEFFDAFIAGELPYGDFLDHVQGWWEERARSNVLFVTYESLWKDRSETVTQVAQFLDRKNLDKQTLEGVVKCSSFEFMKSLTKKDNFLQQYLLGCTGQSVRNDNAKQPEMLRRGVVGDWKNHFTPEQSDRMNRYFLLRTKGTGLESIWKSAMDL